MNENELTEKIIGSAMKVHRELGPGLLESAYKQCLFFELQQAGLYVEKEKLCSLWYSSASSVVCFFTAEETEGTQRAQRKWIVKSCLKQWAYG